MVNTKKAKQTHLVQFTRVLVTVQTEVFFFLIPAKKASFYKWGYRCKSGFDTFSIAMGHGQYFSKLQSYIAIINSNSGRLNKVLGRQVLLHVLCFNADSMHGNNMSGDSCLGISHFVTRSESIVEKIHPYSN